MEDLLKAPKKNQKDGLNQPNYFFGVVMIKKFISLFVVLFFIFTTCSACKDVRDDRTKNLNIGDDFKAFKKTKSLAEKGNSNAQLKLALMYDRGKGVLPNHKEAIKWLLLASDQGEADAQYKLGLMYYDGKGVPKDVSQAHKWFNIASAHGHKKGASMKKELKKEMTKSQLETAKKLLKEWLKNYKKQ